ncbi:hypothetical protein OEZ86_005365 [Tetradesmus obliquus]|nr:hypothetical protein OEZ86_005365 [Tetradesmus obliquus]
MELDAVLPILQKKPYDRSSQDVAELAALLSHSNSFLAGMPHDALQLLCTLIGMSQVEEEPVHMGWVSEGESFGEAALLNPSKPRSSSVVAGDGGVLLAVLDRAAYNRLQAQARAHQAVAAAALQALLAAAARPLLQVPPGTRSADEVECLAELLAGLEAFRALPQPVRAKLAKSCQAVSLPAGAVVFEEDQKGDAMFVVLSGSCQAHASLAGSAASSSAKPSADGAAPHHAHHDRAVEKDGLYWTAKYMADATASATAADPHWGLEGGMTPLAAVFVAKWRQQDPANVSKALLQEVAARADLDWLLGSVAAALEARGLPRRLNKKSSMKITRELNKRMLGGASWKGYGPSKPGSNSHNSQQPATDSAADSTDAAAAAAAGRRAVGFTGVADSANNINPGSRSHRAMRASLGDDAGSELGTEATGLSSCDWRSSLDGSEAASLCMSLDADCDAAGYDMFETVSVNCSRPDRQLVGASSSEAGAAARSGGSGSGGVLSPTGLRLPGMAAAAAAKAQQLSHEQYDEQYGPVIRTLGPGESFGELALLQKGVTRTATVLVTPSVTPSELEGSSGTGQLDRFEEDAAPAAATAAATAAGAGGALLVRVSRSCYDATVRSLQVAALEELLGFLGGVAPLRGLSREALTSLALYARPLRVGVGELLAVAGDKVNALLIIQEGEVKLLDTPAGSLPASHGSLTGAAAAAVGSSAAVPLLPRSRRATADETLLRLNAYAPGSSSSGSGSGAAGSVLPAAAGGVSALGLSRVQAGSAPLAVLGPGSVLGENVLGYDAEQDPLQAIAAAKSHRARQAATAAAEALTHHATAVAASPCRLLVLSAEGLRRFGRRVRAPLAALAADRRDFLQQRRTAVHRPD